MSKINQDELYRNLGDFLKGKGIELQEGAYAHRIRQGCTLLTDAINLTQEGIERAKTEMDAKLDQMRQTIHEKTAPKTPPSKPAAPGSASEQPSESAKASRRKSPGRKRKAGTPKRSAAK